MKIEDLTIGINDLAANYEKVSAQKYGFFLCSSGEAEILLGSQTYEIKPFHLCIYTPGSSIYIIRKSLDLAGVMMQGYIDELYDVVSKIDIRQRLKMRNSPCVVISQQDADSIINLATILTNYYHTLHDVESENENLLSTIRGYKLNFLRDSLCMQIFDAYFSNSPVNALPMGKTDIIFNKFLISVYENCKKERTVRFYANEQHLSPYYFSTIIRNRSGRSVMQWIEDVTIIYAKQMLDCTNDSIKEIAEKLNFPDQSTFGRYFKQRTMLSPSEYRNSDV